MAVVGAVVEVVDGITNKCTVAEVEDVAEVEAAAAVVTSNRKQIPVFRKLPLVWMIRCKR